MSNSAETLTVVQAAERLGIGRSAAYEAIRRGGIPVLRIGHRWLIPKVALDRLLAEGRVTPSKQAAA
jgi:excisionase family DNA binding protein